MIQPRKEVLTIPVHRSRSRNHTATKHWTKYYEMKTEIEMLIRSVRPRHFVIFERPVHITMIASFEKRSHIDASNIDDKIYVDAMRYAKVIKDDNFDYNPIVTKEVRINTGEDKVEIIIEELT